MPPPPAAYGMPPTFPPAMPPPPSAHHAYPPHPAFPVPPQFARGYPVPPPPPPPQFGHYPQPVPPPPQYSQPPHYAQPPQYPHAYAPPLPPPQFYPAGAPPPPPPFPGPYTPQPYSAIPPQPPSAAGPYAAPPPRHDYYYPQPPAPAPPPSRGTHHPPPPGLDRPPGLPPRPPPPVEQPAPDQPRGAHKSKRPNKRGRDRDRNRGGHENASKGTPNRTERQQDRQQDRQQGRKQERQKERQKERLQDRRPHLDEKPSSATDQGLQTPSSVTKDEEGDGEWDFESEQDLARVFPEIETKPADPVGIPLPQEYNDDPTIPPAYNATCVKSAFFNEKNRDEFVTGIRTKAQWSEARWDPIFKDDYPEMVRQSFPGSDVTYWIFEPCIPLSPTAEIMMPPRHPRHRTDRALQRTPTREGRDDVPGSDRSAYSRARSPAPHTYQDSSARYAKEARSPRPVGKRSRHESVQDDDLDSRDLKRSRNPMSHRETSHGGRDGSFSPAYKNSPSPRINMEADPWSPQAGEAGGRESHDNWYREEPSSKPREERVPAVRHDSGYHSGPAQERRMPPRDENRGRRPSDRGYPRRRSPSHSRTRGRSSSLDSRDRSRDRSRSASPLTALEAELLGLADEPIESKPMPKIRKPIKRVKVASAFR